MTNDNTGCHNTIIMTILTLIAIAMLLAFATVAAPLDKLQTSPAMVPHRP